jgi:tRNA U34 5-carboxymethylaminomethyl modifying enzyme MnmG/GidA
MSRICGRIRREQIYDVIVVRAGHAGVEAALAVV